MKVPEYLWVATWQDNQLSWSCELQSTNYVAGSHRLYPRYLKSDVERDFRRRLQVRVILLSRSLSYLLLQIRKELLSRKCWAAVFWKTVKSLKLNAQITTFFWMALEYPIISFLKKDIFHDYQKFRFKIVRSQPTTYSEMFIRGKQNFYHFCQHEYQFQFALITVKKM